MLGSVALFSASRVKFVTLLPRKMATFQKLEIPLKSYNSNTVRLQTKECNFKLKRFLCSNRSIYCLSKSKHHCKFKKSAAWWSG